MTSENDNKIAYLQMIQNVIGRVASDSQNLKTLTMTVAAAIIALAQTGNHATPWVSILGIMLVVLFWWLTSHTLHVERAYRELYERVRLGHAEADFSMDWKAYAQKVEKPLKLGFSQSILVPYAAVIAVLLAVVAFSISQ